MTNKIVSVRYDEKTVCDRNNTDCDCGRTFHLNNKPNKCYFYKKKSEPSKNQNKQKEKLRNAKRYGKNGNQKDGGLKKVQIDSLMKLSGQVVENCDMDEKDYEMHLKIGLSIIESNKNRIKSSYLNFIDIYETFIPNIKDILRDFNLLKEVYLSFKKENSSATGDFLDEFDDINCLINEYVKSTSFKQNGSGLNEEGPEEEKYVTKDLTSKRNVMFMKMRKGPSSLYTKANQKKKELERPLYTVAPLFHDYFKDEELEEFEEESHVYLDLKKKEFLIDDEVEDPDHIVNLIYRDKNYYRVKKPQIKKKKVKKESKAIMINESGNPVKKKKKKKKKNKTTEQTIILPENEIVIPEVKADMELDPLKQEEPEIIEEIKETKEIDIDAMERGKEVEILYKMTGLEHKEQESVEEEDCTCTCPHNDDVNRIKEVDIKLEKMKELLNQNASLKRPKDTTETKKSSTLPSDQNEASDINYIEYSDNSNTNNNSMIRPSSSEKNGHIIHHVKRERTRKKNNRTIEKKLKNNDESVDRNFTRVLNDEIIQTRPVPVSKEEKEKEKPEQIDNLFLDNKKADLVEMFSQSLKEPKEEEAEAPKVKPKKKKKKRKKKKAAKESVAEPKEEPEKKEELEKKEEPKKVSALPQPYKSFFTKELSDKIDFAHIDYDEREKNEFNEIFNQLPEIQVHHKSSKLISRYQCQTVY